MKTFFSHLCRKSKKLQYGEARMKSELEINKKKQRTAIWQAVSVFLFFLFAFFPVWKSLVGYWGSSEDYSHAFFILPVSLYLIWLKKRELKKISSAVSMGGLGLLLGALTIYLVSFYAKITTVTAVSMVFAIIALVWTLYGFQMIKLLAFPLFFLFLMVPIPSQIYSAATVPLQLFVSKVSTLFAMLIGVPVYQEGNVLHLPGRTLQVVEACSGLRSIVSLFTLSLLFGYLFHSSFLNRALLTTAALPIALFVNIVRVFIMLVAFYFFAIDLTSGALHTYFGLLVFLLSLFLLMLISKILNRFER